MFMTRKTIAPLVGCLAIILLSPFQPARAQNLPAGASSALKTKATEVSAAEMVNLNTASQAQLESLKGVGDATAEKIIAGRPYQSVDELTSKGVPQRTVDMIRPMVTVGEGAGGMARPATSTAPSLPGGMAARQGAPSMVPGMAGKAASAMPAGGPIDINSAGETALQALPGVGPALAKGIVAGRPYSSVDDLAKVKGIGPAKLATLRNLVTVGPPVGAAATHTPSAPMAVPAPSMPARPMPPTMPMGAPASGQPIAPSAPSMAAPSMAAARSAAGKLPAGTKVNLNAAPLSELQKLPGIGPVKAQAIIDGRPYSKPEDVMKVKGIKEGVFSKIKDYVTVQ